MDKYTCNVCTTIYDPKLGEPEDGVLPGTPFEKLSQDWECPTCGSSKDTYELLTREI